MVAVVEGLLNECQPTADYAATTATILLTDIKFIELMDSMKVEGIWNQELDDYLHTALVLVLECA